MLTLDPIGPHLEQVARGLVERRRPRRDLAGASIVSAKHHAVEACWKIVDLAMEVSGGAGMFRGNELERLFRDARCGRFHPANTFLVHEIVAQDRARHRSRRAAALGLSVASLECMMASPHGAGR